MSKITPPTSAPQPPVPVPTFDYLGTGSYSPRPDTIASMATKTVKYVGLGALFLGACYLLYSFFRPKTPRRPQKKEEQPFSEEALNKIQLPKASYVESTPEQSFVSIGSDKDYTFCNPRNAEKNTEIVHTYYVLALTVSECGQDNTSQFLLGLCERLGASEDFKELISKHKSEEAVTQLITFVSKHLQKGIDKKEHMPPMANDGKTFAKAAHEVLTGNVAPLGKTIDEQAAIKHYNTLFTLIKNSQIKELSQISQTLNPFLSALDTSDSFKMKLQSAKKCEAFEELVNAFVGQYENKLKEAKIIDQKLDASLYTKANEEYPIVTLFKKKFGE
ncbi:MAG: hypothetical protein KDK63_03745 [Chlamydiia bacterium]|nr:hypothetical protein [Chlamydiia bacterium]